MKGLLLQFLIIIALVSSGFWLTPYAGLAQVTPELILTWQAENFAPPDFYGKVLPVRGSRVSAALEVIDGERLADLGFKEIRWFVGNRLMKSGIGLKQFSYNVSGQAGSEEILKAEVVNYRGRNLKRSAAIPLGELEVVISRPYGDNTLLPGTNILKALVYFFNASGVQDLNFSWNANGETVTGADQEPHILRLDASGGESGDEVVISVQVTNPARELESTSAAANFRIK